MHIHLLWKDKCFALVQDGCSSSCQVPGRDRDWSLDRLLGSQNCPWTMAKRARTELQGCFRLYSQDWDLHPVLQAWMSMSPTSSQGRLDCIPTMTAEAVAENRLFENILCGRSVSYWVPVLAELLVDHCWDGLEPSYRVLSESTVWQSLVSSPPGPLWLWSRGVGSVATSEYTARTEVCLAIT